MQIYKTMEKLQELNVIENKIRMLLLEATYREKFEEMVLLEDKGTDIILIYIHDEIGVLLSLLVNKTKEIKSFC